MVHPRPQIPQGESVAKPETRLLIIMSIACKHDIKGVHGNSSVNKNKTSDTPHQSDF